MYIIIFDILHSGTLRYANVKEFNERYVSPARQKKPDANPEYVPSQRTGQTATYDAGGTCNHSTGMKWKLHTNSETSEAGHKQYTNSETGEPGHKQHCNSETGEPGAKKYGSGRKQHVMENTQKFKGRFGNKSSASKNNPNRIKKDDYM